MKTLLAKIRILAAIDRRGRLSASTTRLLDDRPDLQRFQEAALDLDSRLRQAEASTSPPPPPWLHQSIMNAVRAPSASPTTRHPALRWALALFLIAACGWITAVLLTPNRPAELPSAAEAFSLTHELTTATSSELSEPMNRELDNLRRDARQTAQFILASLP